MRDVLVSRATRLALAVIFVVLLLVAGLVVDYGLLFHAVQSQSHQWCDTLNLLTSHPVPKPASPGANPSRFQNYLFYQDLVNLSHRFGCK
jgi:hypothetical protein